MRDEAEGTGFVVSYIFVDLTAPKKQSLSHQRDNFCSVHYKGHVNEEIPGAKSSGEQAHWEQRQYFC